MLVGWVRSGMRTGALVCSHHACDSDLGCDPVVIGLPGDPTTNVFLEAFSGSEMVSLGEPASTDAIEFDDGKLVLSESGGMPRLDWRTLCFTVGLDQLVSSLTAVLGRGGSRSRIVSLFGGLADELVRL